VVSPLRRLRSAFALAVTPLVCLAGATFAKTAAADPSTTSIGQGYDLGEVQHPRAVALGGAHHAFGGSTAAIFGNPANLPLYRVYHLEALAAFSPEARRQSYGGAIADSSTSRVSGGFGGTWNQMDPDGIKRQWTDLRLSLAYPLGDRLSVGVTGRYLRTTQAISAGPLGASLASNGTPGGPLLNEFTFDAGMAVSIFEGLRLGVTGRNLTAPATALAPLGLATGLGYSVSNFTIEADTLFDFQTHGEARIRGMGGAELLVADRFPIRAGYRYDDGTKTHAVSGGAGYVDRKFSFEASVRRDVVSDQPATLIAIGVRLFYDSIASPEPGDAP
jgi:opacity protein-like surface antigen